MIAVAVEAVIVIDQQIQTINIVPSSGRRCVKTSLKMELSNNNDLLQQYKDHQILHIRGYTSSNTDTLSKLSNIYTKTSVVGRNAIHSSWQVETYGSTMKSDLQPSAVLQKSVNNLPPSSWYCSFVAQGEQQLLDDVLNVVPSRTKTKTTTTTPTTKTTIPHFLTDQRQGNAAWVFIGRRSILGKALSGRPEHVDRIDHDGTYHVQCEGEKIWNVRPNWSYRGEKTAPEYVNIAKTKTNQTNDTEVQAVQEQEGAKLPKHSLWRTNPNGIEIICRPGDLLVINTRLWAHRTTVPPATIHEKSDQPYMSISIARDFYYKQKSLLKRKASATTSARDEEEEEDDDGEAGKGEAVLEKIEMGNVDALFASKSFAIGDVVFTEEEFARVATSGAGLAMCIRINANCDVVRKETGEVVIVAIKKIEIDDIIMLVDPNEVHEEEVLEVIEEDQPAAKRVKR